VKDYATAVLPGLKRRRVSEVANLTPARWSTGQSLIKLVSQTLYNLADADLCVIDLRSLFQSGQSWVRVPSEAPRVLKARETDDSETRQADILLECSRRNAETHG
jgi:hypothetical protein